MVDLSKRMAVMSEIVKERPGLGKTAMMKFVFLLQTVYKVPLGYDFEIYTYGPYSSEVMEEIDLAKQQDLMSIESVIYSSGHRGYNLNPTSQTEAAIKNENSFVSANEPFINKIVEIFGESTAKQLELSSTIVYLYHSYSLNKWGHDINSICRNVNEIKPHFDLEAIRSEYERLDHLGILQLSA